MQRISTYYKKHNEIFSLRRNERMLAEAQKLRNRLVTRESVGFIPDGLYKKTQQILCYIHYSA